MAHTKQTARKPSNWTTNTKIAYPGRKSSKQTEDYRRNDRALKRETAKKAAQVLKNAKKISTNTASRASPASPVSSASSVSSDDESDDESDDKSDEARERIKEDLEHFEKLQKKWYRHVSDDQEELKRYYDRADKVASFADDYERCAHPDKCGAVLYEQEEPEMKKPCLIVSVGDDGELCDRNAIAEYLEKNGFKHVYSSGSRACFEDGDFDYFSNIAIEYAKDKNIQIKRLLYIEDPGLGICLNFPEDFPEDFFKTQVAPAAPAAPVTQSVDWLNLCNLTASKLTPESKTEINRALASDGYTAIEIDMKTALALSYPVSDEKEIIVIE